jgi:hypothetical protein
MIRSSFAKGAASIAAGAMALGAASVSAAQTPPPAGYEAAPPPPPPAYAYRDCKAESNSHGVLGAIIGGGLGAVLGSHLAANHHRADGGLVGAGLGAVVGAGVGSSSSDCNHAARAYAAPPPVAYGPPPPPVAYAAPPPVAYGPPPPPVGYYAPAPGPVFVYGYRGERFRLARAIGPDGCGWAERPVAGPYGVRPGWVRVCRGWHGRFYIAG